MKIGSAPPPGQSSAKHSARPGAAPAPAPAAQDPRRWVPAASPFRWPGSLIITASCAQRGPRDVTLTANAGLHPRSAAVRSQGSRSPTSIDCSVMAPQSTACLHRYPSVTAIKTGGQRFWRSSSTLKPMSWAICRNSDGAIPGLCASER